jgi:ferredoxin-NADP reductase
VIVQFPLRLASSCMVAPAVRHLGFARDDGQPFRFVPGQFVQVHFPDPQGKPLKRSYSVATVAGDPANPDGLIEMAVSYVDGGLATALLSGLAHGETITASGPYGRFVLHDNDANARYLLIATGTGVTPYRAMLPLIERTIAARGIEVVLVYGARTPAELLYGDEFRAFAGRVPGFRYVPCFSRAMPAEPGPYDRQGRVQTALPDLAPDPARDIAYLCGNPDMVDGCFAALKERGLPVPHIRREKYISPPAPGQRAAAAAAEAE